MSKRYEATAPGAVLGGQSETEQELRLVFPGKNQFQMLQQLTEYNAPACNAFAVLGIFRRMYHSRILEAFQEEYSLNRKSLDRRGEVGAIEVLAARKPRELEET